MLFTISRMQKLRDLRDSELDKRPIKSLPAKSRPKSSTNPFPPPSGLFSSSMNRGGISNNARWKPTLPRPAVFIRVGVARCGGSPLNHGRVTTGEKRKSTIFGLAFFLLRIVGNELRRNWNRSGIEWVKKNKSLIINF